MKKLFLLLFTFSILGFLSPEAQAIGFTSEPAVAPFVEAPTSFSKKELRNQRRMERKTERRQKWTQRLQKFAPNALDGNLKFCIFAAGAAVVLSILAFILGIVGIGIFATVLSILSGLAWLAAVVFFVLWLIDEIG